MTQTTATARERALEALAATGQDMVKVDGRWFKLYRGQALDITIRIEGASAPAPSRASSPTDEPFKGETGNGARPSSGPSHERGRCFPAPENGTRPSSPAKICWRLQRGRVDKMAPHPSRGCGPRLNEPTRAKRGEQPMIKRATMDDIAALLPASGIDRQWVAAAQEPVVSPLGTNGIRLLPDDRLVALAVLVADEVAVRTA